MKREKNRCAWKKFLLCETNLHRYGLPLHQHIKNKDYGEF